MDTDNDLYWEAAKIGFCFIGGGAVATALVAGVYKTFARAVQRQPASTKSTDEEVK